MTTAAYQALLDVLQDDPRVRLVYAFGSTVSGTSGPLSDLDIALLLEHAVDWDVEHDLRARLAGVVARVDLVILNDAPPRSVSRW
ncbi:MAG TPA: nucleotidyltransferase domain-containing protein [Candidatus Binatia bacterium]|nr:nucleotidyltransferase domain-containing protein [Candidatus Binatia bacterium]